MTEAIRQIGASEVTYNRWRQEFGGLKIEQVKRLKELELENSRLRKAVSDLTLNNLILREAARGNFQAPRVFVPVSSMCELSWACFRASRLRGARVAHGRTRMTVFPARRAVALK